jgi:CelD/BcsL family acetyltransferase involved in cellulose biosynthesis
MTSIAAVTGGIAQVSSQETSRESPSRAAAPEAAHFQVQTISDFAAFVATRPAWDLLVKNAAITHPFLDHSWIRGWWESFGVGRKLNILTVTHADELVGIAPLMISSERIYGLPVRVVGSIYNDHTPRFDFIVSRDYAQVCEAVWRHLWEHRAEWDVLRFCQLESTSPTLSQFHRLAGNQDCLLGVWPSNESPYLHLTNRFNDHFATLPRGLRANIRRRMKRLEEIGPVEFEQVTDEAEIDNALADALRMEAGTWKGAAGTAIACDQSVAGFYSSIAHSAARQGTLYFTFLRLNGQRIAFDLSLIYDQRLFKLKPGYLQEYHACSPGQQLTTMTIRDAFERGLWEVDFLGSADEWKLAWTKTVRRNQWVHVFKKNLLGSLLHLAKFRVAPHIAAWRRTRLTGRP